ncbi:MAG: iron ABC transporter permease [Bacteroidota bacterium]
MKNPSKKILLFLTLLLFFLAYLHVNNGSFGLDFDVFFKSIFNFDENQQQEIIFREIRFPRTLMAIIAGAGLSISGLLLQTFFKNPLAGPSVLGITSGSSLFVAISILTGFEFFNTDFGVTFSALLGAFAFSLLILFFSYFVKSAVSLLLIGMMLGSFTSAIIQILQLTSHSNQLKVFTLWGFGSLQQTNFNQLFFIFFVFIIGLIFLTILIKPLNLLVLGEKQAQLLGLNISSFKIIIIAVSSLFAGLITAYCGPISFIGLAVPNICKQLFKTQNHFILIIGSALIGALLLLFCDLIIMYIEPIMLIPLNGITALIGAPIVVWIILKKF